MCTVTPVAMAASRARSHIGCTRMMLRTMVSHRVATETAFTLREMHLCSWTSRIYGPSLGCASSHPGSRGDPFIQHHAVSSRNGVVGSTGRNIPATPSPSDTAPNMISRFFMALIHAPKVRKIICPALSGYIIRPPFHNGSKTRDSVPLRHPHFPCTLSAGPVRHLPSVPPFHNGSKTRDSVPLRRPLSPCTLSAGPVRHLSSIPSFHNGSKSHDSVPLWKLSSVC